MSYIESLEGLPERDLETLESIGWHRVLTTYQIRFLHFRDVGSTALTRRLSKLRSANLIATTRDRATGSDLHVLLPSALDALTLAGVSTEGLATSDTPPPFDRTLVRLLVANDLAIALAQFPSMSEMATAWALASELELDVEETTLLPDVIVRTVRQDGDSPSTLAYVLDFGHDRAPAAVARLDAIVARLPTIPDLVAPHVVLLCQGERRALAMRARLEHANAPVPCTVGMLPRRAYGAPRIVALASCLSALHDLPLPEHLREDPVEEETSVDS